MRRATSPSLGTAALALVLAAAATGGVARLDAQEAPRAQDARRGWLGVSLSFDLSGSAPFGPGGETADPPTVTRIVEGSPADRAGLRPGDRIVEVNGTAATPGAFARLSGDLRAGERVSLVLRRQGEIRSVEMEAEARSTVAPPSHPSEVSVRIDSAREVLLGDSTRRELRTLQETLVRTKLTENVLRSRLRRARLAGDSPDAAELEELRDLESRSDSVSRALQRVYRRLGREQARAFRALREGRPPLPEIAGEAGRPPEPRPVRVAPAPSPMTPYLVGRGYVAGAGLTDLNPGLSRYFGVDDGVLVTRVVEGSPAAESGLQAGDVVVAVEDDPVRSLDELRRRLIRLERWPAQMTVVREGARETVRLRR